MDNKSVSEFKSKERCCGYSVCVDICPVDAIKMVVDEEGFLYAKVDRKICINCDKCRLVCPCEKDFL